MLPFIANIFIVLHFGILNKNMETTEMILSLPDNHFLARITSTTKILKEQNLSQES